MKVIFGVDSKGLFVDQGGEKFYADQEMLNRYVSSELMQTKLELERTKAMLFTEMRRKQPDSNHYKNAIDKVKLIVKDL